MTDMLILEYMGFSSLPKTYKLGLACIVEKVKKRLAQARPGQQTPQTEKAKKFETIYRGLWNRIQEAYEVKVNGYTREEPLREEEMQDMPLTSR